MTESREIHFPAVSFPAPFRRPPNERKNNSSARGRPVSLRHRHPSVRRLGHGSFGVTFDTSWHKSIHSNFTRTRTLTAASNSRGSNSGRGRRSSRRSGLPAPQLIGSHLSISCLTERIRVVGIDDMSYGSTLNLGSYFDHPLFHFEVMDSQHRREFQQHPRMRRDRAPRCQEDPRYHGALSTLEVNVAGANTVYGARSPSAPTWWFVHLDVYRNGGAIMPADRPIVLGHQQARR